MLPLYNYYGDVITDIQNTALYQKNGFFSERIEQILVLCTFGDPHARWSPRATGSTGAPVNTLECYQA